MKEKERMQRNVEMGRILMRKKGRLNIEGRATTALLGFQKFELVF